MIRFLDNQTIYDDPLMTLARALVDCSKCLCHPELKCPGVDNVETMCAAGGSSPALSLLLKELERYCIAESIPLRRHDIPYEAPWFDMMRRGEDIANSAILDLGVFTALQQFRHQVFVRLGPTLIQRHSAYGYEQRSCYCNKPDLSEVVHPYSRKWAEVTLSDSFQISSRDPFYALTIRPNEIGSYVEAIKIWELWGNVAIGDLTYALLRCLKKGLQPSSDQINQAVSSMNKVKELEKLHNLKLKKAGKSQHPPNRGEEVQRFLIDWSTRLYPSF